MRTSYLFPVSLPIVLSILIKVSWEMCGFFIKGIVKRFLNIGYDSFPAAQVSELEFLR